MLLKLGDEGAKAVDVGAALRDQLFGLATQGSEVLGACVVEIVRGFVERGLQSDVAVIDQRFQYSVDDVGAPVEDDIDDRPRPLDLAPVLDLVVRQRARVLAGPFSSEASKIRGPSSS